MTETEQVIYGDPAEPGTYECVDCAHRMELTDRVNEMPVCESDDGHHVSRAWQPVDAASPSREISGEEPVGNE